MSGPKLTLGSQVWIPAEINDKPYNLPEEFLRTGLRPAFLPGVVESVDDNGAPTSVVLDWDATVKVPVKLSNVSDRDAEDEVAAALPYACTLDLKHPSIASICRALELRFSAGMTGVSVGNCYVWINPVKQSAGCDELSLIMQRSASTTFTELGTRRRSLAQQPPQLLDADYSQSAFSFSDRVRQNLMVERHSQAIFFKGCSGSGKSELAKAVLGHLLLCDALDKGETVARPTAAPVVEFTPLGSYNNRLTISESRVCKGFAASICLLDAFCTAPSESNRTSSRAIRHFKVFYAANNTISGITVMPLLLDSFPLSQACIKSKDGRKPFSVLTMFLAATIDRYADFHISPKQASLFFGFSPTAVDTSSDAQLLEKIVADAEVAVLAKHFDFLCQHLQALGLSSVLLDEVLNALAVCVHLQSIIITTKPDFSTDTKAFKEHAERLLLGPASSSLGQVLLRKYDGGSLSSEFKTYFDARATCELITWEIYQRVFYFLLSYCNAKSGPTGTDKDESDSALSIDIVDFPGSDFGSLPSSSSSWGSLHQLAINYGAERLLQHFSETVFDRQLSRYTTEGVAIAVSVPRHAEYVDFFESKLGLIAIMAEVSQMAKPDDKTFLEKALTANSVKGSNSMIRLAAKGRSATQFVVTHSFGEKLYDCEGFMSTARARVTPPVSALLASSTLEIVAKGGGGCGNELQQNSTVPETALETESAKTTKKLAVFADKAAALASLTLTRYRDGLAKLLASLHSSQTHYALCIRPTPDLSDARLHPTIVAPQINALQLTGLLQLAKSPFKAVYSYQEFFAKYRPALALQCGLPLVPRDGPAALASSCRALYDAIMEASVVAPPAECDAVVFGKAGHVFITAPMVLLLDSYRTQVLSKLNLAATLMQSAVRMKWQKKSFFKSVHSAKAIQRLIRRFLMARRKARRRAAGSKVHYFLLMLRQHFRFRRMRLAANYLKSRIAGKMMDRFHYSTLKFGGRLLASLCRGFVVGSVVGRAVHAANTIQCFFSYHHRRITILRGRTLAATVIQRRFRGCFCREGNASVIVKLERGRKDRLIAKIVAKIQSRYRGRLIRARKLVLVEASQCLQHWARGLRERARFLIKRRLACLLQQMVRRALATMRLHRLRASAMLKLEAAHNTLVRGEELALVSELHPVELRMGISSSRKGHLRVAKQLVGFDVSFDVSAAYPSGWIASLARFQESLFKENRSVMLVAVGGQHTIVVDDQSSVYSFGFGDNGQLGHGDRRNQSMPLLIEELVVELGAATSKRGIATSPKQTDRLVRQVCCGRDHTLILSSAGHVWAFGANRKGQLGSGSFEPSSKARAVALEAGGTVLRNVKQIACGGYFSTCLTDSGVLYTWGSLDCIGRPCRLADESAWPDAVPFFHLNVQGRMPISFVACGDQHVVVKLCATVRNVRSGVELYAWGHNEVGQLGIGERVVSRPWPTRVDLPAVLPLPTHRTFSPVAAKTPFLLYSESDMVNAVLSCGGKHTLLALKGDVWAWGSNSHGQVGDGKLGVDVRSPRKVHCCSTGLFVKSVDTGWQCSIAHTGSKSVLVWGKIPLFDKDGGVTLRDSSGTTIDISSSPLQVHIPPLASFEGGALGIWAHWSASMTVVGFDVMDSSIQGESPTCAKPTSPQRRQAPPSPQKIDKVAQKFRDMGSILSAVTNNSAKSKQSGMRQVTKSKLQLYSPSAFALNGAMAVKKSPKSPGKEVRRRSMATTRRGTVRSSSLSPRNLGDDEARPKSQSLSPPRRRVEEMRIDRDALVNLFQPFGAGGSSRSQIVMNSFGGRRKQSMNHNMTLDSIFANSSDGKKRGSVFGGTNTWQGQLAAARALRDASPKTDTSPNRLAPLSPSPSPAKHSIATALFPVAEDHPAKSSELPPSVAISTPLSPLLLPQPTFAAPLLGYQAPAPPQTHALELSVPEVVVQTTIPPPPPPMPPRASAEPLVETSIQTFSVVADESQPPPTPSAQTATPRKPPPPPPPPNPTPRTPPPRQPEQPVPTPVPTSRAPTNSSPAVATSGELQPHKQKRLSDGIAHRLSAIDASKLGLGALSAGGLQALRRGTDGQGNSTERTSLHQQHAPHESGFDFDDTGRVSVTDLVGDIEEDLSDRMSLDTLTRPTISGRQRSSTRPAFRSSITSEVEEISKAES